MEMIGTPTSEIWVVVDHPTRLEHNTKQLGFSGQSRLLLETLRGNGFDMSNVYVKTILKSYSSDANKQHFGTKTKAAVNGYQYRCKAYISKELDEAIKAHHEAVEYYKPKVIIALGNIGHLAHDGEGSVSDWRGSELKFKDSFVIPTYSIHVLNKMMEWKFIFNQDIRRARHVYARGTIGRKEYFTIAPMYEQARMCLVTLLTKAARCGDEGKKLLLGVDIESASRHITCLGIAWEKDKAICIPYISADKENFYTFPEELALRELTKQLLTHKHVETVGQNFNYDAGKIAHRLGFMTNLNHDTMLAWHVAYPGLPKNLGFIASMLLPNYRYWKDEGKGHCPTKDNQRNYWIYNAKDAARTLELKLALDALLRDLNLTAQYDEQRSQLPVVTAMEMRGVLQDWRLRKKLRMELLFKLQGYDSYFESLTEDITGGMPLVKKVTKATKPWWRSPTQLGRIFYDIYGMPPQWSRTNKNAKSPSVDNDALTAFGKKEPLLKPLCEKLAEYRSLGVFLSTFIEAKVEYDNRLRTSYGIGATETFRYTSGKYDFIYGANLQNIPSGSKG